MAAKYKVGDWVWLATFDGHASVQVPCPVCFGKLKVTLILGDDSRVEMNCDFCRHGVLDTPRGTVTEYMPKGHVVRAHIREVRIENNCEGERISYITDTSYVVTESDLFDTQEAGEARAQQRAEEYAKDANEHQGCIKAKPRNSYGWNAGYHMREANDHRRQMEYHESMAKLCREKAKA